VKVGGGGGGGGGGIFSGVISAVKSTFFSSAGKTTADSSSSKAPPTSSQTDQSQTARRINIQQPNVPQHTTTRTTSTGRPLPGGAAKVAPIVGGKVSSSAGRFAPSGARGSTTSGVVSPGRGSQGAGKATPSGGRIPQRAPTIRQPSSSFISTAHSSQANIAHSKQAQPTYTRQAPPTHARQAPPTQGRHAPPTQGRQVLQTQGRQAPPTQGRQLPPTHGRQAPPIQLNLQQAKAHTLQGRSVNQRQHNPHIKAPAAQPSVKVKEKEAEESTGFFSAVLSTFYGTRKKLDPEVAESKVTNVKLQTASTPKSFQQRATAVPRQQMKQQTTQQKTRMQPAANPSTKTAGMPLATGNVRPAAILASKPTAAGLVRSATAATVLKAASAAAPRPTLQQEQKVQTSTFRNAPIINPMKFIPRSHILGSNIYQLQPANRKLSNVIQKPIVPRAAMFVQSKPFAARQQKNQRNY